MRTTITEGHKEGGVIGKPATSTLVMSKGLVISLVLNVLNVGLGFP